MSKQWGMLKDRLHRNGYKLTPGGRQVALTLTRIGMLQRGGNIVPEIAAIEAGRKTGTWAKVTASD